MTQSQTLPAVGPSGHGQWSPDYQGSYDEWFERVVIDLTERYSAGLGGASVTGGQIGSPDPDDFGNGTVSWRTEQYWENFVRNYGAQSPYIQEAYGPPPERQATYEMDPNAPSAVQGTFEERSEFESAEAAKDRALSRELSAADNAARIQSAQISADASRYSADQATARAAMQEAGATQRTQMQIDASWREAKLADATRRYIAEGDWGVQKWVTTENNKAAMERLTAELGFRREELAQRAIEESHRHQENMTGLALEVAKYDAELAASPRNWLKYAAWLQNRNVVVNGMSLAMAAQEVPEEQIAPDEVAEATGDMVGAIHVSQDLASGASGGVTGDPAALAATEIIASGDVSGQTATGFATQGPTALDQTQPSPSAEELGQVDDYSQLANDLLGSNPLAATEGDASQQNLQNISNNLQTADRGRIASFGAYGGPTTNALGVEVGEVSGQDVDYRQFANLLPSEQDAKIGEIESIRGPSGVTDFVAEMERSRPKGRASGAASFG